LLLSPRAVALSVEYPVGVELVGAELAVGVACKLVLVGKKEEKQ
jgi:hypothetical protein